LLQTTHHQPPKPEYGAVTGQRHQLDRSLLTGLEPHSSAGSNIQTEPKRLLSIEL
jgi:hypothetical protein